MKLLQKDHEIEADSIKSEDIENEKIWMTGNEDLEGVIARFYGKWSEFNYSVARSEELQDYSHCSKQIGIGKVIIEWISKEDTFLEKVKTDN